MLRFLQILYNAAYGDYVLLFHADTPKFTFPTVGVARAKDITGKHPAAWSLFHLPVAPILTGIHLHAKPSLPKSPFEELQHLVISRQRAHDAQCLQKDWTNLATHLTVQSLHAPITPCFMLVTGLQGRTNGCMFFTPTGSAASTWGRGRRMMALRSLSGASTMSTWASPSCPLTTRSPQDSCPPPHGCAPGSVHA